MPYSVITAKQCLTAEAAQTLDDAVAVARRRVHAQTTSLHAVSSLLSHSSSALREACERARNNAYSGRIQFKALELCFGVAMDRIPAARSSGEEEPPVSNSLMAAIKRAQANQRRMPESFQLYQQHHSSSVSTVKVELQNLVLSILDDPVVSRVFGEAGFRSCDIQLAIIRPLHQLLRFSHNRGPPMFLCNITDENFKRISDVLMRPQGRNPLLIGSCANDALHTFCDTVEKKKGGFLLPVDIYGLNVIRIGSDISKFVSDNNNDEMIKRKFKEICLMVEQCNGPGLIISYGDVEEFISDEAMIDVSNCILGELKRLLDLYGAKVWLIGAAATYETFLMFLNRFSSVVKDWNLQLVPVTSLRPYLGEAPPKSSIMESFVPFGEFLSTSSDLKSPFIGLNPHPSRCHICYEKCEKEIQNISNQESTPLPVQQFHSKMPSWLQITSGSTNRRLEVSKATDESMTLIDNVKAMQQKWDNICQRLHHTPQLTYQSSSRFPLITNHQIAEDLKKTSCNSINAGTNGSSNTSECRKKKSQPKNLLSEITTELGHNFVSQVKGKTSESHDLDLNRPGCCDFSNFSTGDGQASPPSATSAAADLRLHSYIPSGNHPLPCSGPASTSSFDLKDFKALYSMLTERISWQEEAVSAISQAIVRCRTGNQKRLGTSVRGDIWFTFLGPDNFSKKKIVIALVEILYASKGYLIRIDLNSQDRELKEYGVKFRGKNVVDHIAWELSRKPFSVVFLENLDEADQMVQNSLSQALRTGKFPDSHGREVSINNTVFVATSMFCKSDRLHYFTEKLSNFPEEYVSRAKRCPLQIVINCSDESIFSDTSRINSYPFIISKRKSIGISEMAKRALKDPKMDLDLNHPPEETEVHVQGELEDNSKAWFEDFINLVDETVVFKSFDFHKFSEKVMMEVDKCFYTVFRSDCGLEVDKSVVDHILVATYLSEKNEVQEWVKEVLSRGFVEAQKRYNLISSCIVKLTSREGFDSKDKTPGLCLPPRIIVE